MSVVHYDLTLTSEDEIYGLSYAIYDFKGIQLLVAYIKDEFKIEFNLSSIGCWYKIDEKSFHKPFNSLLKAKHVTDASKNVKQKKLIDLVICFSDFVKN